MIQHRLCHTISCTCIQASGRLLSVWFLQIYTDWSRCAISVTAWGFSKYMQRKTPNYCTKCYMPSNFNQSWVDLRVSLCLKACKIHLMFNYCLWVCSQLVYDSTQNCHEESLNIYTTSPDNSTQIRGWNSSSNIPAGIMPIGILMASCQSALSNIPLSTCPSHSSTG